MKKRLCLLLIVFFTILLSACNSATKNPPYPLVTGGYFFEKAIVTNILTKESFEWDLDDILEDKTIFKEWGNLLSFAVAIDEKTEYIYNDQNRCYVIDEGTAYEIIDENTLRLHFPCWRGYDYYKYDVIIILTYQITYI